MSGEGLERNVLTREFPGGSSVLVFEVDRVGGPVFDVRATMRRYVSDRWDVGRSEICNSRVLNGTLEVDDDVVKLGVEDLVDSVERTRKVNHRVLCTSLKG